MEIKRLTREDERAVEQAASGFDHQLIPGTTTRFLNSDDHHLLVAYDAGVAVGLVSVVELTHPERERRCFSLSSASLRVTW
jgi:hypothetical protein